ncbi:hypothetical protein QBC38DRAFT_481307 [Podospora fimiseda]|uniref:Uncharacterized protein n=1 Tax=Podospora fimiseda TaxID=252190 RepID=A0AAN7BMN1_9PEZI|nr:hypothetical protein QBC38DRAFT_481307 [Podospora fimiseda]
MSDAILIQTLTESFIALADEVQSLIDRKTILEHKLRYAHEQYQYLADKYAPAVPEVSETLAKLQIPPELHPLVSATTAVPLPIRSQTGSNQHQLALLIREGRKAAQKLSVDSPATEVLTTTASTVLEKDFTVEGKKGMLACPFSKQPNQDGDGDSSAAAAKRRVDNSQDPAGSAAAAITGEDDPTPHKSSDPICAAMIEDVVSVPHAAASKCPIRYLDKHSPEEIAHYVETHKHEIPRSHEVCVRRYQKNEEQIRKLDAKYGNLVSMVEDLSYLHRPMLPVDDHPAPNASSSAATNKRVEDWTKAIVEPQDDDVSLSTVDDEDNDRRHPRFDRSLREVRVGESPSRPWGIQVPPPKAEKITALYAAVPMEIPPPKTAKTERIPELSSVPPRSAANMAPARAPRQSTATAEKAEPKKCPFDHTKMGGAEFQGMLRPEPPKTPTNNLNRAVGGGPSSPSKNDAGMPSSPLQPTFVNLSDHITPPTTGSGQKDERPQIVFNISGPVFIGYPMEQAMQFMQQYQQGR